MRDAVPRTAIDVLIDQASMECTLCGAGACDCWDTCACGWTKPRTESACQRCLDRWTPVTALTWVADCLEWRGHVLRGVAIHWCPEWDFLPMDETCDREWPCDCYPNTVPAQVGGITKTLEASDV